MVERVGTANVDNRHGLRDPQEHPSINDVVQRSPREHYDPNNDPSDTSTTDTESGDDSSDSEQEAAPTSTQQVRRKRRQRQRLINDAVHKGYLVNPSSYPRGLGEWSWLQTGVDDTAALTLNLTTPGEVTKARQENDPRIPHGIGPDQTPVVIFEPDHRFLNPDELPEGHGHLEYYSESAAEKAWLDYGGNDEYDFENINRPTASEIWAIRQASENFARDIDIVWIPQDGENDTEEENATEDEQYHKEDSDSNYGDAELTDGDFEELQSISPVRKSIASKKDPSGDGPSKYFSSKGVQMVQKRKRDPDSPSKSRREEFKEKYRRRDSSASNDDIDVDIPRIQSSPQSGLPHDAKATQGLEHSIVTTPTTEITNDIFDGTRSDSDDEIIVHSDRRIQTHCRPCFKNGRTCQKQNPAARCKACISSRSRCIPPLPTDKWNSTRSLKTKALPSVERCGKCTAYRRSCAYIPGEICYWCKKWNEECRQATPHDYEMLEKARAKALQVASPSIPVGPRCCHSLVVPVVLPNWGREWLVHLSM